MWERKVEIAQVSFIKSLEALVVQKVDNVIQRINHNQNQFVSIG